MAAILLSFDLIVQIQKKALILFKKLCQGAGSNFGLIMNVYVYSNEVILLCPAFCTNSRITIEQLDQFFCDDLLVAKFITFVDMCVVN